MTRSQNITPSFVPALLGLGLLGLVGLVGPACSDSDAGVGALEVRAWGEDFIEEGIPAEALADAWTIDFTRFEVTVRDIEVAGVALADPSPVDLAVASGGVGQGLGEVEVAAGDHDDAAFTIAAVVVEGSASKAGVSKSFAWTFAAPTRYRGCETSTTVPADGQGQLQITVHADHLFYDSLVADEPALRFEALAAADDQGDGDGVITADELALAQLGGYDPGNLDIADLWSFLAAQAGTMGHVDGEGHCSAEPE